MKGNPDPTGTPLSGRRVRLVRVHDTEQARKHVTGNTIAELSVKETEMVGVGGCQSRGHSDDMGVTSRGSRNNLKSLDCNKEQSDFAAAQRHVGS